MFKKVAQALPMAALFVLLIGFSQPVQAQDANQFELVGTLAANENISHYAHAAIAGRGNEWREKYVQVWVNGRLWPKYLYHRAPIGAEVWVDKSFIRTTQITVAPGQTWEQVVKSYNQEFSERLTKNVARLNGEKISKIDTSINHSTIRVPNTWELRTEETNDSNGDKGKGEDDVQQRQGSNENQGDNGNDQGGVGDGDGEKNHNGAGTAFVRYSKMIGIGLLAVLMLGIPAITWFYYLPARRRMTVVSNWLENKGARVVKRRPLFSALAISDQFKADDNHSSNHSYLFLHSYNLPELSGFRYWKLQTDGRSGRVWLVFWGPSFWKWDPKKEDAALTQELCRTLLQTAENLISEYRRDHDPAITAEINVCARTKTAQIILSGFPAHRLTKTTPEDFLYLRRREINGIWTDIDSAQFQPVGDPRLLYESKGLSPRQGVVFSFRYTPQISNNKETAPL